MSRTISWKWIVALWVLGIGWGLVVRVGLVHVLDLRVTHWLQAHQPGWFVRVMQAVSLVEFGQVGVVLPVFFILKRRGKLREAWLVLGAGLSWFGMRFLKVMFGIPCPTAAEARLLFTFHNLAAEIHQAHPRGFLNTKVCYPSGHVFDYINVWGSMYLVSGVLFKKGRWIKGVKMLAVGLMAAVGLSRISLGAHFFSDVVGGYLLGLGWWLGMVRIIIAGDQNRIKFL